MSTLPTSPKAIAITIGIVVASVLAYNFVRRYVPQLPSLAG